MGLATRFEDRMQCVGLEHMETDWGRQVQGKTTQGHGENDVFTPRAVRRRGVARCESWELPGQEWVDVRRATREPQLCGLLTAW